MTEIKNIVNERKNEFSGDFQEISFKNNHDLNFGIRKLFEPTTTEITSTKLSEKLENKSIPEITKSAFFQDFLLNPIFNVNEDNGNPLTTEQTFLFEAQTTTEPNLISTSKDPNQETKLENIKDLTNRKIIEDFWQKFNEKSILFSEPNIDNQSQSLNTDIISKNSSNDYIIENIDPKSIMISEGVIEAIQSNKDTSTPGLYWSTPVQQTTERQESETPTIATTVPSTVPSTTIDVTQSEVTDPKTTTTSTQMTTIELETKTESTESPTTTKSPEYLNSFWHSFNDNSDEYLEPIANKTIDSNDRPNTTTEVLIFVKSNTNSSDSDNPLSLTDGQDLTSVEDKSQTNLSAIANKALPLVQSTDDNQSIPPLSAIFKFPHSRKRVRKVQRLRSSEQVPNEKHQNMNKVEESTTTATPEESDIMSTDATEELEEVANPESDQTLKLTASQRVYHYIPPFHIHRETYANKNFKPDKFKRRPAQYSITFDDMSEIMSSIKSMKRQIVDREQQSVETKVKFDDQPDSFVSDKTSIASLLIQSRPQSKPEIEKRFHSYLLPLEPQRDDSFAPKETEITKIKRNIYNFKKYLKYEPIIRIDV